MVQVSSIFQTAVVEVEWKPVSDEVYKILKLFKFWDGTYHWYLIFLGFVCGYSLLGESKQTC